MMALSVHELDRGGEEKWDAYAEKKGASLYHFSKWRHLIKNVFGHDSYYLYVANENDVVVGILPLIRQRSFFFGDYLISMPYFNYGGVICDNIDVGQLLKEAAENKRSSLGCSYVELRDTQNDDLTDFVKMEKVSMLLNLPEDAADLWQSIGAKRRAQIKRPIREGAEYFFGGIEYLDDFYKAFSINMRDLGTPVYGKTFFKEILTFFPESSFIALAKINGEIAGAGFLMGHNGKMEIPWASSLRKYNKFGINMFLYWNMLKTSIEKKYNIFDFGRSSKDAGTLKFKKQWGAEPIQLYWKYLLPDGVTPPEVNPQNPKYNLAIQAWQKLPVFVTRLIGPSIVKNLP